MTSSKIFYVQTTPVHQTTTSQSWANMQGLAITLPAANADHDRALIFLNVPNPYATGNNHPAAWFGLKINNALPAPATTPIACFSYSTQILGNDAGRVPTTLVVEVKLGPSPIPVQAVWQSIRNSTLIVDTPCSLSAVLGN